MSLSVSSFPEAPPRIARYPKWQETLSLKCSGKPFGTFFSKRSVPFLKGIGDFAKTHVKGSIIHLRVNVPSSRFRPPSSPSKSSIQASSIVIDIIPIDDVDNSSLVPTIEISPSTPIGPVPVPTFPTAYDFPAVPTTDPIKALHQLSSQYLVEDCAQVPEKGVEPPANEHEEAASVVYDSKPHNFRSSDAEVTITSPLSLPPMTPAAPYTVVRRRSRSASAGINASAKETVRPTRPRYKSETAIGSRRPPTSPDAASSSTEGKGRVKNPTPPLPINSSRTSTSPSILKQRLQRHETRSTRARSGASIRSTRSIEAADFPLPTPPLPSPPLPNAHMLSMLSGSRLTGNHIRSKMSDGVSTRSRSPSLVVGPSDGAPVLPPLPSSVDSGLLSSVPRAE